MKDFQQQLWQKILANQGIPLQLHGGRYVTYATRGMTVVWIALEETQKNLYSQSLQQIAECIPYRLAECCPSSYPGSARSYKWSLLNSEQIFSPDLVNLLQPE